MNVLFIINGPANGSELVEGAFRSSMERLADWTLEAERLLTF